MNKRIRELEAALEFYSNPGDYKLPFVLGKLYFDCGAVARVALKEAFYGDKEIVSKSNKSPYGERVKND